MKSARTETLQAPLHFNFATDVMDVWARLRPDERALWCVNAVSGKGQRFTFGELQDLTCRAASFMAGLGVRRGDRVLLMLPRVPEWWIAMLGLLRLGALPVPATLLLTERDVGYRITMAQISAVVTNAEGAAKVDGFEGLRLLVGAEHPGWVDFDEGVRRAGTDYPGELTRSDDPAMIYFTSATTGEPKMVLHTHASYGLGHRLTGQLWLDLKPGDLHWNLSDLGWGKAAWSSFFGPWQMGACIFALDTPGKFDPVLTLNTLAEFPITTWCSPPTALRLVIRQDLSRWKLAHLRHCVTAGEPLNPEVLNLWRAATGLTLYEAYGQTETVVLAGNFRCFGEEVRPGSMGKPTPGMDVQIIDESLQEVPAGCEGEIAMRLTPRPVGLFKEYWRNEAETAQKFRDNWYLTGDRAYRDADGYFWFIGRKDDVIKSSGYRIGPFEVESALMEHPAVLEVGVVGKPDALRGQIVKACVVLRPGYTGSDELKAALQVHCKSLIAAYKYPREVEFVSELPKTTSGKTRHMALRQAAASHGV